MEKILTKQDILDLFAESDKRADKRATEYDKIIAEAAKRNAEYDKLFYQRLEETGKEWQKEHDNLTQKIREVTGSWSKFSEELVKPKIIDLFLERGINLTEFYPHVKVKKKWYYFIRNRFTVVK